MATLHNSWKNYRRTGGWRGEFQIFLLCLALGVLVLPAAIYLVGKQLLGAYQNGGYFAYMGDFGLALLHFVPSFWLVALGPWLGLCFLRLVRRLLA